MCYPLLKDKSFVNNELGIALLKVNDIDCHVGVYWCYNGKTTLIHFVASQVIMIEDATKKNDYRFESLEYFNPVYIPTLEMLAPKIALNKLNLFKKAVKFDGYKFDMKSGAYLSPNSKGNHLNCAAFSLALIGTFNIELVDWNSWPLIQIPKNEMEQWVTYHKLDKDLVNELRDDNREIRGKHVGAAALSNSAFVNLNQIKTLTLVLDKILK